MAALYLALTTSALAGIVIIIACVGFIGWGLA